MGQKKIDIDDSRKREREGVAERSEMAKQKKNEEKLKAYRHEAAFERAF